ncbi:hypothetical protein J4212_05440 [Candidatus Woesearchaeota archaeon]|nr:hypothetical protein [Candidatus Woesearchaeota archaeon]
MELIGNTIKKSFVVKHKGEKYFVNYINSDYADPILFNRDNWQILDEDGEELGLYFLKSDINKDNLNQGLLEEIHDKLISFCVENFDNYQPILNKI